jgi:hypothetical protein
MGRWMGAGREGEGEKNQRIYDIEYNAKTHSRQGISHVTYQLYTPL